VVDKRAQRASVGRRHERGEQLFIRFQLGLLVRPARGDLGQPRAGRVGVHCCLIKHARQARGVVVRVLLALRACRSAARARVFI
jgi:hypothetical protein